MTISIKFKKFYQLYSTNKIKLANEYSDAATTHSWIMFNEILQDSNTNCGGPFVFLKTIFNDDK